MEVLRQFFSGNAAHDLLFLQPSVRLALDAERSFVIQTLVVALKNGPVPKT